jgi:hypothetical protein
MKIIVQDQGACRQVIEGFKAFRAAGRILHINCHTGGKWHVVHGVDLLPSIGRLASIELSDIEQGTAVLELKLNGLDVIPIRRKARIFWMPSDGRPYLHVEEDIHRFAFAVYVSRNFLTSGKLPTNIRLEV